MIAVLPLSILLPFDPLSLTVFTPLGGVIPVAGAWIAAAGGATLLKTAGASRGESYEEALPIRNVSAYQGNFPAKKYL